MTQIAIGVLKQLFKDSSSAVSLETESEGYAVASLAEGVPTDLPAGEATTGRDDNEVMDGTGNSAVSEDPEPKGESICPR